MRLLVVPPLGLSVEHQHVRAAGPLKFPERDPAPWFSQPNHPGTALWAQPPAAAPGRSGSSRGCRPRVRDGTPEALRPGVVSQAQLRPWPHRPARATPPAAHTPRCWPADRRPGAWPGRWEDEQVGTTCPIDVGDGDGGTLVLGPEPPGMIGLQPAGHFPVAIRGYPDFRHTGSRRLDCDVEDDRSCRPCRHLFRRSRCPHPGPANHPGQHGAAREAGLVVWQYLKGIEAREIGTSNEASVCRKYH